MIQTIVTATHLNFLTLYHSVSIYNWHN